jgi:hypothetical protein
MLGSAIWVIERSSASKKIDAQTTTSRTGWRVGTRSKVGA